MTYRILTTPTQASVSCARLPSQEIELGRREMVNTSGGILLPSGPIFMVRFIAERIAEVIDDYFDDGS